MTLRAFIGSDFTRSHENEAFRLLCERLSSDVFNGEDMLLIGNALCNSMEIDAILFKKRSIIVIDFKNFGGSIAFAENGPWLSEGGVEVKGGSYDNPFQQVRAYKRGLSDWFRYTGYLGEEPNVHHIQGLILFQQDIVFDKTSMSPKIATWFGAVDYRGAIDWLRDRSSPLLKIDNSIHDQIISALNLKPYLLRHDIEVRELTVDGGSINASTNQEPTPVTIVSNLDRSDIVNPRESSGGRLKIDVMREEREAQVAGQSSLGALSVAYALGYPALRAIAEKSCKFAEVHQFYVEADDYDAGQYLHMSATTVSEVREIIAWERSEIGCAIFGPPDFAIHEEVCRRAGGKYATEFNRMRDAWSDLFCTIYLDMMDCELSKRTFLKKLDASKKRDLWEAIELHAKEAVVDNSIQIADR
jgi:hypothetical protein